MISELTLQTLACFDRLCQLVFRWLLSASFSLRGLSHGGTTIYHFHFLPGILPLRPTWLHCDSSTICSSAWRWSQVCCHAPTDHPSLGVTGYSYPPQPICWFLFPVDPLDRECRRGHSSVALQRWSSGSGRRHRRHRRHRRPRQAKDGCHRPGGSHMISPLIHQKWPLYVLIDVPM